MPKVIFAESTVSEKDKDLCRIVDWLYQWGKIVQIVTLSTMSATYFDNLLWSFNKESFVPHVIGFPEKTNSEVVLEKVFITTQEEILAAADVVVVAENQSNRIFEEAPMSFHFVLMDDEEQKQKSRNLWKFLTSKGIEKHHLPYRERKSWIEIVKNIFQPSN